jgi:hypothetical protein
MVINANLMALDEASFVRLVESWARIVANTK